MKIEPIVINRIQTRHTSFQVDLHLENNITFLGGDSGTGRSTVFSFLKELSAEDKRIKCFNYLDWNKSYKSSIKRSKGKLIIIDNRWYPLRWCNAELHCSWWKQSVYHYREKSYWIAFKHRWSLRTTERECRWYNVVYLKKEFLIWFEKCCAT